METQIKQTVVCEVKSGIKWVKKAMLATMGLTSKNDFMTLSTFMGLVLPLHSPIEEMEFWFKCVVYEDTHVHIVRHKELGKYVCSSRKELKWAKPLVNGMRKLDLRINLKRLIEVNWLRNCSGASVETKEFMKLITNSVIKIIPQLEVVLQPKCVWYGWCPESRVNCFTYKNKRIKDAREKLIKLSELLKEKNLKK